MTCFRTSSDFLLETTTINDDMLKAYDTIVEKHAETKQIIPLKTTIQSEVEVMQWRKSSLSTKLNTLLLELETNMESQKITTDQQILIRMKERQLTIITEIYHIETTMIRIELSNLRNIK